MKLLSIVLVLSSVVSCNLVPTADVMPAYGTYSISGGIGATSGGGTAISQSLSSLGIGGSQEGFAGRIAVEWLNFQLAVSGFEADYSGTGTTTAEISFEDEVITADTDVNSALDLRYLNGTLTWDLIPTDLVDIGVGIGVAALDLDLEATSTVGAQSVSVDEVIPLPELALRASANLGLVGVFGTVGWISGEYQDFDGRLLDIDLHGRVRIVGSGDRLVGHLAAGYRYVDTEFEFDDGDDRISTDLQLDGPYVGFNVSF